MPYLIGKHPYLKLKVKLPKGRKWLVIECLIDTGFSGGLVLPLKYQKYFPENEFIEAHYLLADNSEITVTLHIHMLILKEIKKRLRLYLWAITRVWSV